VLRRARGQRHDPGRPDAAGASVQSMETRTLPRAVRTPAARRQRWQARQIEAAGGLAAYRQQERERVRAVRRRPPAAG